MASRSPSPHPVPPKRRSHSRSFSGSPRRERSRSRTGSPRGARRRSRSRSYGGGRDMSPSEEGYRVYVGDLGLRPSQSEIERAFKKIGEVLEVWLARNPPCFAFVVYKYQDDADEAVRVMDGAMLCGNRVRCSIAKPRRRGGRGGYGGGPWDREVRCYQCGGRGHFARNCRVDWERSRGYSRRSRSRSYDRGYGDYGGRDYYDRRDDRYDDRRRY